MGLLAPEGRFGAVRKEPVRPLVEADPTVRQGARQQPLVPSHQPLAQQPGVFHGFSTNSFLSLRLHGFGASAFARNACSWPA